MEKLVKSNEVNEEQFWKTPLIFFVKEFEKVLFSNKKVLSALQLNIIYLISSKLSVVKFLNVKLVKEVQL